MPKREIPQQTVKLIVGGGAAHVPMVRREKRLMANSQSASWARYTESRLRQFVTR